MRTLGDVGAGHVLGRYELLIPIASGGMATVWAARLKGTRGFQKFVAVKTMLPSMTDDAQFEQMFLDEATLAARIRHPNVVEILDLGEDGGVLFIVMEWVDGEPLSMLIKAAAKVGGIPLPVAVRIATQTCAGLHAAHELRDDDGKLVGLVHRDVSPQNVLVTFDGVVKIVDFGVAKATAAAKGDATQAGQIKGKAAYMSPEQARGMQVDRRTDVFAMGILLYQLTTGKHPFRGENEAQSLLNICSDEPALPPSRLVPGYPAQLEAVVLKAIEKDLDKRFPSTSALMHALDKAVPTAARMGTDDQVSAFVKNLLSERKGRRDRALKEALRVAAERGASAVKVQFPEAGEGSSSGFTPPSKVSDLVKRKPPRLPGTSALPPLPPPPLHQTGSRRMEAVADPASSLTGGAFTPGGLTPSMGSLGNAAAEIQLQTAMASAQSNKRTARAVLIIGALALVAVAAGAFFGAGSHKEPVTLAAPVSTPPTEPTDTAATTNPDNKPSTTSPAAASASASAAPIASAAPAATTVADAKDAGRATPVPTPVPVVQHYVPRPVSRPSTQPHDTPSEPKPKPASSAFVPSIRNPGF